MRMASPAAIYRQLGARVRELRVIRKLTQAELAEKISRSTEYIGKVERGEKRIQIEDLAKASEALDVSLSDMFRGVQLHVLRAGRHARERRARYEPERTPPTEELIAILVQLARSLDEDDVTALAALARRLLAARLVG